MIICSQCAHENPDDHKFCGECGTKLPPQPFLVNDYFQDRREAHVIGASPMVKEASHRGNGTNAGATRSREGFPQRSDRQIEDLPAYEPPDRRVQKRVDDPLEEHGPAVTRSGPTHYSGGISGPSFLGLSDEPAQSKGFVYDDDSEPREENYDPSYLLEESPRGTSWKAYALLLIVMIFGGLAYLQWKSQIMRPPSRDVSNVLSNNGEAIPEGGIPDFAKEKAKRDEEQEKQKNAQAADAANAPTLSAANTAAPSAAGNPGNQDRHSPTANTEPATKPENTNPEKTAGANAERSQSPGVTVKSNGPRPQEGVTVSTDGKHSAGDSADNDKPESDTNDTDTPDQPATRKSQSASKTQTEDKPHSLGAKDPLLIRAQKFLHGRGVPQDCNTGLNLLRQSAETNSKAQIQMGALYMTGNCVTQDRVSAYKWFSQALAQEPNNEYIERNRASLWASMTPQERKRVRQADFY